MILILSNKRDLAVDFVVAELRRRNAAFLRLNTEDLPCTRATVRLPDLQILVSKRGTLQDLTAAIRVVWNRRPGKPFEDAGPAAISSSAREFAANQWYSWLEALELLPNLTWINHPQANHSMENKVRQLLLAHRTGFHVPETWVTNDPEQVREAARHHRRLIGKALHTPLIQEPDADFFILTTELAASDPAANEEIRASPTIFQPCLYPKTDYRVTVVGEIVLAARIEFDAPESAPVDWRAQKEGIRFLPVSLPAPIETLCRSYLRAASLLFGAIDLVEHNGEFTFLEINPNGEWGWLQKPPELAIAESLCDLLIQHDEQPGP